MGSARRGGIILLVGALALAMAGTADAKKKKAAAKKHKTPAAKDVGGGAEEAPEPAESSDSAETKDQPKAAAPKADQGSEEAPASSEGEAKPAPKAKPAAAEETAADGALVPPALEFVLGGGALFRNLAWSPASSPVLAPYSLTPGPEAHVTLEVYPAAFATAGFAANIGIFGGFGYGFGVTSKTSNGTVLTTKFQDFLGGLKLRIPLGMLVPYVSVAYGAQSFRLDGQGATITVPATNYKFIRGGLGTRVRFSPMIDLDVGGGFVSVTNPGTSGGEIASMPFFPHATAYAVDAGLSLGVRLMSILALRAGVDFRQYGLAFNVKAGEQAASFGVSGAIDRYVVAWGGIEMVLDGLGGGATGSEEEAKPAPAASKKAKHKRQPEPDPGEDAAD